MATKFPIVIERVPADQLTERQLDELWRCYSEYVDGNRERFINNVKNSDEVLIFRDEKYRRIRGLKVNKILALRWNNRPITVVYTAYADLDPKYRGANILQRLLFLKYISLRIRHPFKRLFWMSTASTYTSYLLYPRNFVDFWPRRDRATPVSALILMNDVMRKLGAEGWNPKTAVLKRHGCQRYREGVVKDDPRVLKDPDIRFYARMNPGQHLGDSLACICPLTLRNVLSVLANMLRRRQQRRRVESRRRDGRRLSWLFQRIAKSQ